MFNVCNITFLLLLSTLCLLPFLNLLAISFSSKSAVVAGKVWVFPVGFTWNAYRYLLQKVDFFRAFLFSLVRVFLGTTISLAVTALMSYPLAFAKKQLAGRRFYLAIVILSMFFNGGLVPSFIVISKLGLYNKLWALILPGAMNCWNMILFINFFRQVPKEMMEAASLEGAGHWNAWFDGYLYMSKENWPLQTYIYHMMEEMKNFQLNKDKMTAEELELLAQSNDMTLRAAQIFIAMLPVLCVYPLAQKYFVKGILLGSVKE